MFTGIIEELGHVKSIRKGDVSAQLEIEASTVLEGTKIGDSIATNGVCLTVTSLTPTSYTADVMHESLRRSSLGQLKAGSPVNLERAMALGDRFGGHIVSGHIDGMGRITNIKVDGNAIWYTIEAGADLLRYIVEKGSITIDGVSLTVAAVEDDRFSVSLIPHTAAITLLGRKGPGDVVNLETDILAKYVEKLLRPAPDPAQGGGLTLDFLAQNGF